MWSGIFQQKVQQCDSVQPLQRGMVPGGALALPPHKGGISAAQEAEAGRWAVGGCGHE